MSNPTSWKDLERIRELEAEVERLKQTNLIPTHRAAVLFAENHRMRWAITELLKIAPQNNARAAILATLEEKAS